MSQQQNETSIQRQTPPPPPQVPIPDLPAAFPEAAEALPLIQAYERHHDPVLFADYIALRRRLREEARWRRYRTSQGIEGDELDLSDRHGRRLLTALMACGMDLQQAFINKLIGGEITAWARVGSPLAPWAEIPAAAWCALKLDELAASTVKSPGGEILYDVRIGPRTLSPPPLIEAGTSGRPSSAHLVLAQFEERVKAGQVCETLRAEAKTLAGWLLRNYKGRAPQLGAKRIEQVIRAEFNAYKARRADGKPQSIKP